MDKTQREIRGLMITVAGGRLLLPNANVSEIITAANREPIADAPPWLLGRVRWRGWRVPLVSMSLLAGLAARDDSPNAKVAVLKGMSANPRLPYIAILSIGFPRLTTVSPENLVATALGDIPMPGMRTGVMLNDQSAFIPDLPEVERLIDDELSKAT